MAKTRQVLKMNENGHHYTVVKVEDKANPYRVYRHTWEQNKYGYLTERKRCVEKYANMASVLLFLADLPEI